MLFCHWGLSKAPGICIIGSEAALNAHVLDAPNDKLPIFFFAAALRVPNECSGFFSNVYQSSSMDFVHVAQSTVTLPRFYPFMAKTICFFRKESSHRVEVHKTKLYHDTFGPFVPLTSSQPVGSIGCFVQN